MTWESWNVEVGNLRVKEVKIKKSLKTGMLFLLNI